MKQKCGSGARTIQEVNCLFETGREEVVGLTETNERQKKTDKERVNVMNKEKTPLLKSFEPIVFLPAFIVMIGVTILGLFKYETLLNGLMAIFNYTIHAFGWTYIYVTMFNLALLLILLVHPLGKTRLGGPDTKPELSTFTWFATTLCTTVGISLIMWGGAEPVFHFMNPPEWAGVAAGSSEAASFALSTGYIHWSFNQYALYTFAGVAIAIFHYNHNRPLSVAAGMYGAIGENKLVAKLVDALCLIVIVGGVASSLGIGITQLSTGLNYAFGIQDSQFLHLIIAVVVVATYCASSYSGVKKGVAFISRINVWIFFGLLLFVFIVGPTMFEINLGTESLGYWMEHGLHNSLRTGAVTGDSWHTDWTINFFALNAAYAPLEGLFLAKLARGRSVRGFVGMNLVVCSLFNIIWFIIMGGASIYMQINGIDLNAIMNTDGLQACAFALFQNLPLGVITVPVFTFAIFISFVTMGDSMCTSMAAMSMRGGMAANVEEPNSVLKIIWGIFVGLLAYFLLGLGGVESIKYTYMVFGFPTFIICFGMIYTVAKWMFFPDFKLIQSLKGFFSGNKQNV